MLQLDRNRNARHPTQNFLNKNRRAVRDVKSKSQTLASGSGHGKPSKPHPPASRPPQQKSRARLPGSAGKPSGTREGVQEGTVVISKSYLDQLLLMTNGGQGKGLGLAVPQDRGKAPADHTTLQDTVGPLHHAPHPRAASPAPQHSEKPRPRAADTVRNARPVSPEGYFPFGRPGCGAPLRTDSGQVIADLRQRQRQCVPDRPVNTFSGHTQPVMTSDPGHSHLIPAPSQDVTRGVRASGGEVRISADMGSPRYARGAGPHVDKYMLREREEQRKKHLEHVDFLKAQIAAKEQAKREERERREREEREEEARLAKERERLQSEYQREMERAKQKEEESRYRQELIQRAIDEATEQALLAKQQAKAHRSPRRHNPQAMPTTGPSHSTFSPAHAHSSPPKVTFDLRSTHTLESGNELLVSDKFQALRSPSMLQLQDHAPSSTSTQRHKDIRRSQELSNGVNMARETGGAGGGARGSRIPVRNSRVKERAARTVTTQRTGQRQLSPQHMQRSVRTHGEGQRSRNVQGSQIARAEHVRVTSPPVPALAKKLGQHGGVASAQGPASLPPPSLTVEEPVKYVQMGVARSDSPPVPALAKKLRHGMTEPTSAAALPTKASHPAANLPQKANSLPVINPPAHAVKDRQVGVASTTSYTHLPPIVSTVGNEQPHPPTSHVILQELAALRKGLLSHRSIIDRKLSTLLHNH